jgi:hypothetical protein
MTIKGRTYMRITGKDGESNFQMNFCRWILTCLFYSKDKPMSTLCKGLLSQNYLHSISKSSFDSSVLWGRGWLLQSL